MSRPAERDTRALSDNAAVLLQAVARGHAYGFELMEVAALPSGTVYPLLRRLEARGLVRSRWEDSAEAIGAARPRRRYYQVTAAGREALPAALERLHARRRAMEQLLGERER
jgi:PadR family transcriptional regulator, regulatory protein PadR